VLLGDPTASRAIGAYQTLVDDGLVRPFLTTRADLLDHLARARSRRPFEVARVMNFVEQSGFEALRGAWKIQMEASVTDRFPLDPALFGGSSTAARLADTREGTDAIMHVLRSALDWRRDRDSPRISKTVRTKGAPSWHIELESASDGIPGVPAIRKESATLRFEEGDLVLAHESGTALCLPPGRVHIPREVTLETLANLVVYLLVGDRVSSNAARTVEQYVFTKLGRTVVDEILRRGLSSSFEIRFDRETARPTWRIDGAARWTLAFRGDLLSAASFEGGTIEAEPHAFWKRMESLTEAIERRIIPAIDPSFEHDLDRIGRVRRFAERALQGYARL
jgi:hypothetical protein